MAVKGRNMKFIFSIKFVFAGFKKTLNMVLFYFISRSGAYRLVYYSAESKDILGISSIFQARYYSHFFCSETNLLILLCSSVMGLTRY